MIIKKGEFILSNTWSNETLLDLIQACLIYKPKDLFIDAADEWEIFGSYTNPSFAALKEVCLREDIAITSLLGSYDVLDYNPEIRKALSGTFYEFFPFNWLCKSYKFTVKSIENIDKNLVEHNNINYLFYTFINRPHKHRCIFLDTLHEYSLETKGHFTWNILQKDFPLGHKESPHQFQYWEEQIVRAPDNYANSGSFNHAIPEDKFFESLFEIVLESTTHVSFFTEKTWKPIVMGKPFILYGHPTLHKKLKDLGFLLFEEIIDYSFDNETDDIVRAKMICKELDRIKNMDYNILLDSIRSKLSHNKTLAKNLALKHKNDRKNFLIQKNSDLKTYLNELTIQIK